MRDMYEIIYTDGSRSTRRIVTARELDILAASLGYPRSMSEHLNGWAEEGDFTGVAWSREHYYVTDTHPADASARLLYPGEPVSLRLSS